MARIAATEDVEGLRDEQEVDDSDMGGVIDDLSASEGNAVQAADMSDDPMDGQATKPPAKGPKRRFVATIHEVNEAFDSVNTLRYSQPTHLQGTSPISPHHHTSHSPITQGNAKVSPSPLSAPATLSAVQSGKFVLRPPELSSML